MGLRARAEEDNKYLDDGTGCRLQQQQWEQWALGLKLWKLVTGVGLVCVVENNVMDGH